MRKLWDSITQTINYESPRWRREKWLIQRNNGWELPTFREIDGHPIQGD